MKNKYLILIIVSLTSTSIFSQYEKSIYGADNRRLVRSLSDGNILDQTYLSYSQAILAQIPSWRIDNLSKNIISIKTKSLKDGLKFCSDESFLDEPIVSSCTAFLVAPDLIVTAGHCIKDKFDCKKNSWVIDYHNLNQFQYGSIEFQNDKIFQCAELISHIENSKLDFALIRLDRKIEDRKYLKIRTTGKTDSKEPLVLLGHPLGMPLMVTDKIFIRDNTQDYVFKTNADSFSGNSGSPLIGINSGLVEGILIRGDDDYFLDTKENCNRTYKCSDKDCRGESVLRSSYLPNKEISN